jgi:hypothetical protein
MGVKRGVRIPVAVAPLGCRYIEQYERMKRGYARLSESFGSSIDYDDDLQHFFQVPAVLKKMLQIVFVFDGALIGLIETLEAS